MQETTEMINRKDRRTIRINNRNICILHDENGTSILNTKNAKLNIEELLEKTRKSLGNQEWRITQIIDIYNSLIESSELTQMVQYILSSSVLTSNILNHPKEEIELNNQVLERLKRFMSLIDLIATYHKNKNDFLGKWKPIFDIITILTSFKDIYYLTSTTHICVDLYPRTEEADIFIRENQCFGSIVFINSNSKFSFKQEEKSIGFGITNRQACAFSGPQSRIPINIFGSSLVQVVYPSNDCVDERGMFVILNKDQEENTGIGEIISFGDLITRGANSYHLIGICSLDKTEQPTSLFLFSISSHTSRIRHPSDHIRICFVSMISLPMNNSLVHLLLQSTPLHFNKDLLL